MYKLITMAAIALIATGVATDSVSAAPIWVVGAGTASCGTWLAHRSPGDPNSAQFDAWVTGYVTGVNQFADEDGDVTGHQDSDGMIAWVTTYCTSHPLDKIATAAGHLVLELQKRKSKH